MSPVSPDTHTEPLGKPRTRRVAPSAQTDTVARSRWVKINRPPPIGRTSHGWSSPVTWRVTTSLGSAVLAAGAPEPGTDPAVGPAIAGVTDRGITGEGAAAVGVA